MKANQSVPKNIDEYIAGFPNEVQEKLEKIRLTIQKAVPEAEEKISYQIPAFTWRGTYLIYFAAYKQHIGLYPAPRGVAEFKEAVAEYGAGKGTLRFPFDKPIPFNLVSKIVKYRMKAILEKAAAKAQKRSRV